MLVELAKPEGYGGHSGQVEWASRKAREIYGQVQDCWVGMKVEDDELKVVQEKLKGLNLG
jgi:hypothetical protein